MKKLDDKILELKKVPGLYEFTTENCFLAGGAVRDTIRGVKPKDYDLFFYTEEGKSQFVQNFSRYCNETGLKNFNYNDFQFITLMTGEPQKVVDTFDWNVNQCYYELLKNPFRNWGGTLSDNYLRFNVKARKPLSAYLRLPEMLAKGFVIEKEELVFLLSFLAQTAPIRGGADLSEEFEFLSSGGGFISSNKAEAAVNRASEEARKHSPLYKIL